MVTNRAYGAIDPEGRRVEIKATTGKRVALAGAGTEAERLIVLSLDSDGLETVEYDGDAAVVWLAAGAVSPALHSEPSACRTSVRS
jgi:hypothetical protein